MSQQNFVSTSNKKEEDEDDFIKVEKMSPLCHKIDLPEHLVIIPQNHASNRIKPSCTGVTLRSSIMNGTLSNRDQFIEIQQYEKVVKNWDTYKKTKSGEV